MRAPFVGEVFPGFKALSILDFVSLFVILGAALSFLRKCESRLRQRHCGR